MASRSPAIFLLLALPLLCYVVSIEAHNTLPDDIVPNSPGLSDDVVPEFSLEARSTKGLKDEVNEFIEARATKGLKDEVTKFKLAVRSCDSLGDCPTTIEHCLGGVVSGHLSDDCHGCAVCIAGKLDITLHDLISKVSSRLTKALNGGLLQYGPRASDDITKQYGYKEPKFTKQKETKQKALAKQKRREEKKER